MLYTVVPLERIFRDRTESVLGKKTAQTNSSEKDVEYKSMDLPHGRVYAKRNGDNYIVDGISSTDMGDYLNPSFIPGTAIDISNIN
jgi:hypothetical protein